MNLDINITLIVVVVFAIYMIARGYRKGMVKELSGLIALAAAFVVLAVVIMLVSSYQQREVKNIAYLVFFLILFGAVYGVVQLVLKSIKFVSKLPVINLFDSLLGMLVGFCQAVLIVWVFFMLCENGYLGSVTEHVHRDIAESTVLSLLQQYNFLMH